MFATDTDWIPRGLDAMEPGPVLAAALSAIDVGSVSGHDRVAVLRAHQRMASHHQAQVYEAMAAVSDHMHQVDPDPRWAIDSAATEIQTALRLTRRAADVELAFALDLQRRLPRIWNLLASGAIDLRRAKTVDHGTAHLGDGAARRVDEEIAEAAPRLTSGQLHARVRKLCIDVDPQDAERRHERAVAERRVVAEPTEAGTVNLLGLDLPPDRVATATSRINHLAHSLRGRGESRSMDQLRADVLLDLLNGTGRAGKDRSGGVVDLHVDLATLAGLAETCGELGGYGPVIADIARRVAAEHIDGQWRYSVTDPDTRQVVVNGITGRRPTAAQRRHVEARHRTCAFPGCRRPAVDCDLDHRIRYTDGGPTRVHNLVPLCRHHHVIHHHAGWRYQPLPGGDYRWTSPLGHAYTTSGTPP